MGLHDLYTSGLPPVVSAIDEAAFRCIEYTEITTVFQSNIMSSTLPHPHTFHHYLNIRLIAPQTSIIR